MKTATILSALLLCIFFFSACTKSEETVSNSNDTNHTPNDAADKITYEQISQDEAKEIMDTTDTYILLDVRTQEEYDAEHIEGAILIPDYEIASKAETLLTDKDALILVYCRSGRRSKNAASELATLGYTNVKEFGGIIDWKYDTVTN